MCQYESEHTLPPLCGTLTGTPTSSGIHTCQRSYMYHSLTHTHSLTNTLTHSLTTSLPRSLTHSLTHHTHSLTKTHHSLTHSPTHSLPHSLTNTRSHTHTLTHSHAHSLTLTKLYAQPHSGGGTGSSSSGPRASIHPHLVSERELAVLMSKAHLIIRSIQLKIGHDLLMQVSGCFHLTLRFLL